MERKRGVEGEGSSNLPPSKQLRHTTGEAQNAVSTDEANEANGTPDDVRIFQRSQLTALVEEQRREMKWLYGKVEELQQLVAVLDAAPRAALYHMGAVQEDLTLTLARLGVLGDLSTESVPLAATLLDAEVVTNESLGEVPSALKALSAQIILALEKEVNLNDDSAKAVAATTAELHNRVRRVSDQLERYAERDKESLVSSTTLKDELEDLRAEKSLIRRRIVALEHALKAKDSNNSLGISPDKHARGDDTRRMVSNSATASGSVAANESQLPVEGKDGASGADAVPDINRDLVDAEKSARALSAKRLKELKELHEERKGFLSEIESLRTIIARRDAGVVPMKSVLGSALYQTMEATLQQLYLKERKWQDEREAIAAEREEERKYLEERLTDAKQAAERMAEDYKKQIDDLRRTADAAKAEKDKVVITYEARKVEAGNGSAANAASDRRVSVSEEMREKLASSNAALQKELATFASRLAECENMLAKRSKTPDSKKVIELLQKDLEAERAKSAVFVCEVESLSTMFAELETENGRLSKQLAEKEQVLSKVMGERLRGRQLLTTVKEENRVLSHAREVSNEKIKALTAAVNASKKVAAEATAASNKALEEARMLAGQLEKRRRIADDATVSARTAIAEKEEMKQERDALLARAEQSAVGAEESRYSLQRLEEENTELRQQVEALEATSRSNGRSNSSSDMIKDEIIRELRKKLNCSIVTTKPKEVVLLRCGHLFSRQCTDDLVATRNRKCPICGKAFGADDVRSVFF